MLRDFFKLQQGLGRGHGFFVRQSGGEGQNKTGAGCGAVAIQVLAGRIRWDQRQRQSPTVTTSISLIILVTLSPVLRYGPRVDRRLAFMLTPFPVFIFGVNLLWFVGWSTWTRFTMSVSGSSPC